MSLGPSPQGGPSLRAIRVPAYVVLTTALVLPLLDYANGLFPLNLGDAIWRFGAMSLVASYAIATTVQLLFLFVLAAYFGDNRVLFTLAVVSGIISILLLGGLGLFGLDALQARSRTSEATRTRLETTAAVAALKLLVLMVGNATLARFAWREARRGRAAGSPAMGQVVVPRNSGAAPIKNR